MKAHIGVDAESGLMHTVVGKAENVSDVTLVHALRMETGPLRSATPGVERSAENVGKAVAGHVALKRSKREALPKTNWAA